MHRTLSLLILPALFVLLVPAASQPAEPYKQVRGVIHLDSSVSGGEYTPEDLIRLLKKHNLHVAIFSDQATLRWEYGVFPARWITGWITNWVVGRLFGRTGSVQNFGPREYLEVLNELDRRYPEVIVIPGVEAIPFYYWEGSLLNGSLTLKEGNKHLLVFGMSGPGAYEHLPSVGNGFFRGYNVESLLSLWPLVLLFLGYKCYRQARQARWGALYRAGALLFLLTGVLFLLNNFPFKFGKYDQYHGDQGMDPYQDFIDYVISRNGLVFWAHPEVTADEVRNAGPVKVRIHTEAYYLDLLKAYDYTGFAAFAEGMKYMAPPGGVWDVALLEYCTGKRARPIWAIAEGDVESDRFSPTLSQTVFLLKETSRQDVLQALREGRVYAVAGPLAQNLTLADFRATSADAKATAGQVLQPPEPEITVSATLRCAPSSRGNSIKADLVRNGKVIASFRGEGELQITHPDTAASPGRMNYYRLDVRAPSQTRLLSNPVFVGPVAPL